MFARIAIGFLLLSLSAFHGYAAEKILVFGAVNYPPYDIQDPEDIHPGIDIEILEYAMTEAGRPFEIRFMPWARALAYAQEGKISGLISCGDVPERRSFLAVSDPTSQLTQALVVRADYAGMQPERIEDFNAMDIRFGAVRGYADEGQLKQAGVPHTVLNSTESGLRLLMIGRIDALWSGKEAIQFIARNMKIGGKVRYLTLQDREPYLFRVCLSRKWPDYEAILADFNKALHKMRESGVHRKIMSYYR
ncbi:substrate-binding periplasmic protein [Aestuariispira ectoiniformans]|uniref:substrate-binding periplasmic protein n=1 Tax=Aestuariispira ectoiniformans TaxID=2775080 RepID=UPI00223A6D28|nr:transporter substrate-binding domain-containing protein [Aestuariispira ectoiniformans]